MFSEDLIPVDVKSDDFLDFTVFAWNALVDVVAPMNDEDLWRHVERIDWAANSNTDYGVLSQRLASGLSLIESCSFFLAALDVTGELEDLMDHPEIDIPSEDGTEDFLYHLVGLGREFVSRLSTDPSAAVRIAAEDSYVESFRYVLEGTRRFYSLRDYVDAFESLDIFASADSAPKCDTMRMVSDGLPGVVVRIDPHSFHVVTPIDSRDIPTS